MSKNKMTLSFDGMEEMINALEKKQADLVRMTETALEKSGALVAGNIEKVFIKSKMPAKGKYATGQTKRSILHKFDTKWEGSVASVDIGFDMSSGRMVSIFLIYGTPKMKPVAGLKSAIYGTKTKKQVQELQKEIFSKMLGE